jgi:hypothetical protein
MQVWMLQTSDVKGAGTNARVHLAIYGKLQDKEIKLPQGENGFQLENSHDNFERGKLDVFMLENELRLSEISRVVISHDGSGLFSAWHLAWLEVGIRGGKQYFFKFNDWVKATSKQGSGQVRMQSDRLPSPLYAPLLAAHAGVNASQTRLLRDTSYIPSCSTLCSWTLLAHSSCCCNK